MSQVQRVVFSYDIPEASRFPNPSDLLWAHGFRYQLSCWIMSGGELAHPDVVQLMDDMKEAKINYRIIRFDVAEEQQLRDMAAEALQNEAREIHTRLIKSLGTASDALQAAKDDAKDVSDGDLMLSMLVGAAEKKARSRYTAVIQKAEKALEAAIECALKYDLDERLGDCLEGLANAIHSRRLALAAQGMLRGKRGAASGAA